MTDEPTQAMIDAAMARAERGACEPEESRCSVFLDPPDEALQTRMPNGRCLAG